MKKAILESIENLIKQQSEGNKTCIIRTSELENFHPNDVVIAMSIMSANLKKFEIEEVGVVEHGLFTPIQEFSRNIDYYRIRILPRSRVTNDSSKGIRLLYNAEDGLIFAVKDGKKQFMKKFYRSDDESTDGIKMTERLMMYLYNHQNTSLDIRKIIKENGFHENARLKQYLDKIFDFQNNRWALQFFPVFSQSKIKFKAFVSEQEFEENEVNYSNICIIPTSQRDTVMKDFHL